MILASIKAKNVWDIDAKTHNAKCYYRNHNVTSKEACHLLYGLPGSGKTSTVDEICKLIAMSQMGLFVPAAYFEHKIIWEIEFFCNLRLMSQSDQVSQFGSELSTMNRILNKKKSNSIRPSLYIIDNWGQGTLIGKFLGTFSRINYP